MDSQTNGTSSKSLKVEYTAPSLNVGTALELKQFKGSQNSETEERMKHVLNWTTSNRKSAAWSDNSSCLESDDSCDSSRLQIAWNGDNHDTQSTHSEGSESSGNNSTNVDAQSIVHLKNALLSHPLKRYNAVITLADAKISFVYHKSMARQFPAKDRTPEQLEMRRRNTEAARYSRAKLRMAELLMQKEAEELKTTNTVHKQMIASQLVYANELSKLLDMRPVELKFFERIGKQNSDNA